MGGTFWGAVDEEKLSNAVRRAVELGVNFFDTADAYGDGLSEEILSRALKPFKRDDVVIATKVYHHPLHGRGSKRVGDLSHDYIVWECEQSLKRLGTDYVDLYQAHVTDQFTHPAETARAFETLKAQGKIRNYGCSNFTAEQLRTARRFGDFDTLQPKYSLHARDIEADLLPLCMAQNVGVLCYSPLHHGLLTGKYTGTETFDDFRADNPDFQGERFRENCARVDALKPIAGELGKSVPQLALRFVLDHPGVHCAIAGIKSAEQIEDAAGAADWTLSREQYYDVRRAYAG
jgi:aryl-alcohol dehydrogenase-like predicted oxidoreductase